jgi:hypothetical protein
MNAVISGVPSKSDDAHSGGQSLPVNVLIAPPSATTVYTSAVIAMTALYTVIFVVTMGIGWLP